TMSNSMRFSSAAAVPAPPAKNSPASATSPMRLNFVSRCISSIPDPPFSNAQCSNPHPMLGGTVSSRVRRQPGCRRKLRALPARQGGRRRRTKEHREIGGRRRERNRNGVTDSRVGRRIVAGCQGGNDEVASELFGIRNAVDGDQQKADQPGPRG